MRYSDRPGNNILGVAYSGCAMAKNESENGLTNPTIGKGTRSIGRKPLSVNQDEITLPSNAQTDLPQDFDCDQLSKRLSWYHPKLDSA